MYFLLVASILLHLNVNASSIGDTLYPIDIIGDWHHSRYNFTDAVVPYYGVDGWTELKYAHWLDKHQKFAPYACLQGSWMFYLPQAPEDIRPFDWQRSIQIGAGLQWHPLEKEGLRGIRLFAFGAVRQYFKKEPDNTQYSNLVRYDMHLGADYYFDNLFDARRKDKWYAVAAWSNFTFRLTNFSRENFNAFFWTGNVKWGWRAYLRQYSRLFCYIALDWTSTLSKSSFWWENYIHPGAGIRLYPFAFRKSGKPQAGFLHRLHFYSEWLWEGAWLREKSPARVKTWDLRFGIGYSTPGFYRNKNRNQR